MRVKKKTAIDYDYDLERLQEDFDIVPQPDEWVDILEEGDEDNFNGADNLLDVETNIPVVVSLLDELLATQQQDSGSQSAAGGGGSNTVPANLRYEHEEIRALSLSQIADLQVRIRKMRQIYTEDQKSEAICLFDAHIKLNESIHSLFADDIDEGNNEAYQRDVVDGAYSATHKYLTEKCSRIFDLLSMRQLRDWVAAAIKVKLKVHDVYKKQDIAFHQAIWDKLMLLSIDEETGEQQVIANILCTYEQVRKAAKEVQSSLEFVDDEAIKKLTFSDGWICKFISLNDMARRRVSGEVGTKPLADDEKINKSLDLARDEIRRQIRKHNITNLEDILQCIWNFDETGITYRIGILYGYLPKRGRHNRLKTTAGESNKGRITGLLGVNAGGVLAPPFLIVKHSKSKYETSAVDKHTILDTAYKNVFTATKGWSLKVWTKRNVTYPSKAARGGQVNVPVCNCKYLIHDGGIQGDAWRDTDGITGPSFTVITGQHKAYNDTVRQLMYNDLIIHPIIKRLNLPFYIHYQDGCSIHGTADVVKSFEQLGVFANTFEPYLTAYIQPLDLIINGLVKMAMRAHRVEMRTRAFEKFKTSYNSCSDPAVKKKMKFTVPIPRWQDAVKLVVRQYNGQLKTEELKKSVKECFFNVGLAPNDTILDILHLSEAGKLAKTVVANAPSSSEAAMEVAADAIDFEAQSAHYLTNAPGAFRQFKLKEHTGDVLTELLPISRSVEVPVVSGDANYPIFLGVHRALQGLKTSEPGCYMMVLRSIAREYNIPGNLSLDQYSNRLCKLISLAELNTRVVSIKHSLSSKKALVILFDPDDEPVGDEDEEDDDDDDEEEEDDVVDDDPGSDDEEDEEDD